MTTDRSTSPGLGHSAATVDPTDCSESAPDWDGARFIVGDTRQVLKTLPDASVDLVLTSPPFLALRSYLPADDPNKPLEIGQEAGPGEFIDALLDVVEECRRVLKPTGSLAFELGDTYAGSGGGGGDYLPGGMREGQQQFAGSAASMRESNAAHWRQKNRRKDNGYPDRDDTPRGSRNGRRVRSEDEANGILAARSRPGPEGRDSVDGWPMDKSLCLIPEIFRFSLVYGFNPLTGRSTDRWRARNVVRWCRPNPPVGFLSDKFRPATSDMVIACTDRNRYFDLDSVRTPHKDPRPDAGFAGRDKAASDVNPTHGWGDRVGGANNPNGAPPLDWWEISTSPYKGSHYATWPEALLHKPIKAMCPSGGVVLDPFAGSGTTLGVALGLGRRAIGIDLDRRNADLAYQRVGMFLTIEEAA